MTKIVQNLSFIQTPNLERLQSLPKNLNLQILKQNSFGFFVGAAECAIFQDNYEVHIRSTEQTRSRSNKTFSRTIYSFQDFQLVNFIISRFN